MTERKSEKIVGAAGRITGKLVVWALALAIWLFIAWVLVLLGVMAYWLIEEWWLMAG